MSKHVIKCPGRFHLFYFCNNFRRELLYTYLSAVAVVKYMGMNLVLRCLSLDGLTDQLVDRCTHLYDSGVKLVCHNIPGLAFNHGTHTVSIYHVPVLYTIHVV